MSGWRVAHGGLVDRSRPIGFRWQGRAMTGLAGDTLASALLANGEAIVGRSFKYHRPRGLLAAGLEEPNAIVQLGQGAMTIPNLKATQVELFEGLEARAVNAWPSPGFDVMAINGLAGRFIPAAFYYKTFMWPGWHWFEPAIRRAAGLGVAPAAPDPEVYAQRYAHCAVLIIGGGLAGLTEALAQARAGRSVILIDGDAVWGGRQAGSDAVAAAVAALAVLPDMTMLLRTLATGYHDHDMVSLAERVTDHLPPGERQGPRQRLWKVRAGEVVLATGAIERPLVFAGNDLPGVMLASAAATYLSRFGVAPGRRIVVATTGDSGHAVAAMLAAAGAVVAAVLDSRKGETVLRAHGRRGVTGVRTTRLADDGRAIGDGRTIACDTVLMAGGWSPAVHLHSQAGGALRYDPVAAAFVPAANPQNCRSIGGAAGDFAGTIRPLWQVARDLDAPDPAAWVDFQNDVTAADIALAARENFRSVEHLKRYTTLGMASDQGKTSNVNGIGIMAQLLGRPVADIGTTMFRPPYDPVPIGVFAAHRVGETLRPRRQLPAAAGHAAMGAVLEEYGGWMRPAFHPLPGEDEAAAVAREARAVRSGAGLFDASPLGKIMVKGPDAGTFLDRMYVGTISTLQPGRCRYGLMLDEHGVVFDDGIVARVAADVFLAGSTSGHATAVAALFDEWLQCEFTGLKVAVADVTAAWAVMTIAGPRARDVLARLATDIDLAAAAFPHLAHREGRIEGWPCRIQRVSFSGELSYEISVPARHAMALQARVLAGGDVTPFGIEALMALRIEKGFLHIGSDTDGMTMPQDVGFGGPVTGKRSDFIGRRSAQRPDAVRSGRRQFVGLASLDDRVLPVGGHVVAGTAPQRSQGWVTSSVMAPNLGRPHALAMVEDGRARLGEIMTVLDLGTRFAARIVAPCAFDPDGVRLHG